MTGKQPLKGAPMKPQDVLTLSPDFHALGAADLLRLNAHLQKLGEYAVGLACRKTAEEFAESIDPTQQRWIGIERWYDARLGALPEEWRNQLLGEPEAGDAIVFQISDESGNVVGEAVAVANT